MKSALVVLALILALCSGIAAGGTSGAIFITSENPPWLSPQPHTMNPNAADTTNADQLWPGGTLGLNLNGSGLTVGVWDGGWIRTTHQELTGRVTIKDAGASVKDHSTHVAGTIAATGVAAAAHGMANQVKLWSYDWTNDYAEMAAAAPSIVAANHSYGYEAGWSYSYYVGGPSGNKNYGVWYDDRALRTQDAYFGKYTALSQNLDSVLYQNPKLLDVWSAGNERGENWAGLDTYYVTWLSNQTPPGWYYVPVADPTYPAPPADGSQKGGYDCLSYGPQLAKNNLVVGAISAITADPYNSGNVVMATFSSWGSTDDGRVKPDVVGDGMGLYSSIATNDTAYATYSGTSMAAPNITGTATLLIQHYSNLYGTLPRSATTKGLLIHTAFDAGNVGPDYVYGWGVADGSAAANFLSAAAAGTGRAFLYEATYTGTEQLYTVPADSTGPLKVTLAWTDPAPVTLPGTGLDDRLSVLVHDLDLWVVGPGGTTYYPWNLDPLNPANAAFRTALNHRDNVEQVLIDLPTPGLYTIHIGRTGAAFTQDYSLFISGIATAIPEPAALSLLAAGALLLRRRLRR